MNTTNNYYKQLLFSNSTTTDYLYIAMQSFHTPMQSYVRIENKGEE